MGVAAGEGREFFGFLFFFPAKQTRKQTKPQTHNSVSNKFGRNETVNIYTGGKK